MLSRFILVALLLVTFGCSSATYIRAKVTDNPLDRVAQQAQEDWSVTRVDANTLRISDAWPIHSFFSLGYTASHAHLFFGSSPHRVGDFGLISYRVEHAGEDFQAQVLLVA